MRMARKAGMMLCAALCVVIFLGAAWGWRVRLRPLLLLSVTRTSHMSTLAHAVAEFDLREGRLPTNLSELVMNEYVPARSVIYGCPMKVDSLRKRELEFSQCEFELRFEPDSATIAIPAAVFADRRFSERFNERVRFLSVGHRPR